MDTPTVPLAAWRNRAFVEDYGLLGQDDGPFDLTGASLRMEVRLYGAQPGDALISLTEVGWDVEGIRVIDAVGGRIRIVISQNTLASLPGGPTDGTEPNAPDPFVYDLVIARPIPADSLAMSGTFTLHPGVSLAGAVPDEMFLDGGSAATEA